MSKISHCSKYRMCVLEIHCKVITSYHTKMTKKLTIQKIYQIVQSICIYCINYHMWSIKFHDPWKVTSFKIAKVNGSFKLISFSIEEAPTLKSLKKLSMASFSFGKHLMRFSFSFFSSDKKGYFLTFSWWGSPIATLIYKNMIGL